MGSSLAATCCMLALSRGVSVRSVNESFLEQLSMFHAAVLGEERRERGGGKWSKPITWFEVSKQANTTLLCRLGLWKLGAGR